MSNLSPKDGESTIKRKGLVPAIKEVLVKVANTAAIPVLNHTHTERKVDPHFRNIPVEKPKDYPVNLPR